MKRRDPHQWSKERNRDKFFLQAKKEGYRARSAYKLIEINQKFFIIKPGFNVLDLGAAPGAWLQVVRKITNGKIDGIDLLPIAPINGVIALRADIFLAAEFLAGKIYDVILSDIAPNCSGQQELDHLLLMNLANEVLALSKRHLKIGGNLCIKIFDGVHFQEFFKKCTSSFTTVKRFKPESSALDSCEFYLVCMNFKG